MGHYLSNRLSETVSTESPEFSEVEREVHERVSRLLAPSGKRSVTHFHRELGRVMWEHCGMARNEKGLEEALRRIPELRQEFWEDVNVPGEGGDLNQTLERAGRVADYFELAELMCRDALERRESCGCHLRDEFKTESDEAARNDDAYCHVAAWEYQGDDAAAARHEEPLTFEHVHLAVRNYK